MCVVCVCVCGVWCVCVCGVCVGNMKTMHENVLRLPSGVGVI